MDFYASAVTESIMFSVGLSEYLAETRIWYG